MKKLLLACLLLSSHAVAMDGIPMLGLLSHGNSYTAQSYTSGAVMVDLSFTASASGVPLTVIFSGTGATATGLQYEFGYETYTPSVYSGFVSLSQSVMIDKLDPNLQLYFKSAGGGPATVALTIFSERR